MVITTDISKVKEDVVGLEGLRAIYHQEPDSSLSQEDNSVIEIFTQDAGGGHFFVIKTERWAFNDVDEVIELLYDFKKRFHNESK